MIIHVYRFMNLVNYSIIKSSQFICRHTRGLSADNILKTFIMPFIVSVTIMICSTIIVKSANCISIHM